MNENTTFPVKLTATERDFYPHCPTEVPYEIVTAHERQALANTGKTVSELAAEGGLTPTELYWILNDRSHNANISPDIPVGWLTMTIGANPARVTQ